MADLEAKLQSIEQGIQEVKKVIETHTSPHNPGKRKSHGSQTKWLRTVTALILQISVEFQDVKAEFRQHLDGGGNTVRAHRGDAQESAVESQTHASETNPGMGQQSDHSISTTLVTDPNSPSVAGKRNTVAMVQDDSHRKLLDRSLPLDPDANSPCTRTNSACSRGSNVARSDTNGTDGSEGSNCVFSTKAPIFGSPSTFSLSIEQMGASLVENAIRFAGEKGFSGIISVEDLPLFDWPSFKTSMKQPEKGYDLLGVEYFSVGLPGAVGLRVSKRRSSELPDFDCVPDQPSLAECETFEKFIRHLVDSPPKGPFQYYVGPSLSQGPPASKFDDLLDPGLQLSQFSRIPGRNEPYWHIGQKGSGTGLHKEDAQWWSFNVIATGWRLWIRIWTSHTAKLEAYIKKNWCCNDCDQFVRHQNLLISLDTLRNEGIGFDLDCVGPGQMVVTETGRYHAVINITDCFAVAINFLPSGEALFPKTLRVCRDCGLYPLEREEFVRVPSTDGKSMPLKETNIAVRKRQRTENDSAPPREVKRIVTIQVPTANDLREVMARMRKVDSLCRFPSLECGATSELFGLAAAIMSPAAVGQFQSLVTSMREIGTDFIRSEVGEGPISRLVRHIRTIDISGRRTRLEKFIVRSYELLLAEEVDNRDDDRSRLRAKSPLIKSALAKTGWTRTTFDYHLKRGRQWKRVCGIHEGLLCFLFLEGRNPFDISLDQYLSLKGNNLEIFHRLLRNDYITTICAAGKAFQTTLQSTNADIEFSWEGKYVSLEKASEADLLKHIQRFPTPDDNLYIPEKHPGWPRPDGWPDDWPWPCDPTWVPPDQIKCDLCGKTTICDCINFPPRTMPRITFYRGKGRGLRAVASTAGACAYKKGQQIDKLTGELVPLGSKFKDGWSLVLKRPILDDEHAVCQIYCGNKGNLARLVNSACQTWAASAVVKFQQVSGRIRVILSAKRDILDGEEITAYYGRDFMKKGQCRCDACLQPT